MAARDVLILLGSTTLGAGPSVVLDDVGQPFALDCGDVDGDGFADLAVLGTGNEDSVTVFLNPGDGGATLERLGEFGLHSITTDFVTGTPSAIVVGDFDGDQRADLATSISVGGAAGGVSISLGRTPSPLD